MVRVLGILLVGCGAAFCSDELTIYELLTPDSHSFAITYDMSTDVGGAAYLFNPIR